MQERHSRPRKPVPRARDAARGEDGYNVVEFVIGLPTLVVLVLIVVQVALWLDARSAAESAAREGVQTARGYQSTAADGSRQALAHLNSVAPTIVVHPHVALTRTPIRVTARIHAGVLTIVPPIRLTVNASAAAPTERFVP